MILRRKLSKKTRSFPKLPRRDHRRIREAVAHLAELSGPADLRGRMAWDPASKTVVPVSVKFLTTTLRNFPAEAIAAIELHAQDCVRAQVRPSSSPRFKALRGHQFARDAGPRWLRLLVELAAVWHNTPGKLRESRRIVRSLRKAGAKELIPVCCRPRIRKKNLASV